MSIEVFVGCSPNGEDAESLMVLEYSIRKHTNRPVNITYMHIGNGPTWTGWETSSWATPFSGFRWSVPAHMNFEGQGIYMDSDMIILSDIGRLWDQEFEPGKVVLAKGTEGWRYCVCKWNNKDAKDYLLSLEELKKSTNSHQRMMGFFSQNKQVVQPFKGNWNCIDGENLKIEDMDILHYSDMACQLHLSRALPRLEKEGRKHWFDGAVRRHRRQDLVELFDKYYEEALTAGYSVNQYLPETHVDYTKHTLRNYGGNQWSH